MSVEYIPWWERLQYNASYFGGGDLAGLKPVGLTWLQNVMGRPTPYAGYLGTGDDAREILYNRISSGYNSIVSADAKQRNLQTAEENLTRVTDKFAKTFGIYLDEDQIDVVRQAASMLATYGPGIADKIQKLLENDFAKNGEEDKVGQIMKVLLTQFQQANDALFGPIGNTLPFVNAMQATMNNMVALDEQAPIMQSVYRQLYSNQATLQDTQGMNAAATGSMIKAMDNLGASIFNPNTLESQRLLQEKISEPVSPSQRDAMIQNIANTQKQKFAENTGSFKAIERLTNQLNNSKIIKTIDGKTTSQPVNVSQTAVTNYAQQVYKEQFLVKRLQELGYLENGADFTTTKQYEGKSRNEKLRNLITKFSTDTTAYAGGDEKDRQRSALMRSIETQLEEFEAAETSFIEAMGFDKDTASSDKITGQKFINAYDNAKEQNIKEALEGIGIDSTDAELMANAMIRKQELESYTEIKDVDALLNDENKLEKFYKNKNIDSSLKEKLSDYYRTTEINGQTVSYEILANRAQKEINKQANMTAQDHYDEGVKQYDEILRNGTPADIEEFENGAYRDVVTQIKANILAKPATSTIKQWDSAYKSMQHAIERTGSTINGQKVQFWQNTVNPAVTKMMNMITQGNLASMSGEDVENFFTEIGTGMERSKLNADQVLQLSGLAADAAAKIGGDRAVAAKIGTRLGLAAATTARERGFHNADRIASMVAQATGRTVNSLISQYTGAILLGATPERIASMKDPTAKAIATKIMNRQNLTHDELAYLRENGTQMMSDMGMDPEQQRVYMTAGQVGADAEYAATQGAVAALGNENSDVLIDAKDAIGVALRASQLDETIANNDNIQQAIVDTLISDPKLIEQRNPELFKNSVIKQVEKQVKEGKVPQSYLDTLVKMNAVDFKAAALKSRDVIGAHFGGDAESGLGVLNINREDGLVETSRQNLIRGAVGKQSPIIENQNFYSRMLEEIKKEDSNLGTIMGTLLTGSSRLTEDEKSRLGFMSSLEFLTNTKSHLFDSKFITDKYYKAREDLDTLIGEDAQNAGNIFNLIKDSSDIIQKSKKGSLHSLLKAIDSGEDVGLDKKEIATINSLRTQLKDSGLEDKDFDNIRDEITKLSAETKSIIDRQEQINETRTGKALDEAERNMLPPDIREQHEIQADKNDEKLKKEIIDNLPEIEPIDEVNADTKSEDNVSIPTSLQIPKASGSSEEEGASKGIAAIDFGKTILDVLANYSDGNSLKVSVTNTVTTTESGIAIPATIDPPVLT